MFSAFIIALREGFEIAIAIAILLIYLRKTERMNLVPAVVTGIIAAVIASVACGYAMSSFLSGDNILEGPFYLLASVLVISMIVWMWRTSMQLGVQVTRTVERTEGRSLAKTKFIIGGFAFILVLREGIELVIFLLAISSSTEGTAWVLASVGGLLLSVLVCVGVVRGFVKVDMRRFFKASALVLMIFVVQLVNGAAHEFIEHNWIPNPGGSFMRFIDWAEDSNFFADVAVIAFLLLIPYALIQSFVTKKRNDIHLAQNIHVGINHHIDHPTSVS